MIFTLCLNTQKHLMMKLYNTLYGFYFVIQFYLWTKPFSRFVCQIFHLFSTSNSLTTTLLTCTLSLWHYLHSTTDWDYWYLFYFFASPITLSRFHSPKNIMLCYVCTFVLKTITSKIESSLILTPILLYIHIAISHIAIMVDAEILVII